MGGGSATKMYVTGNPIRGIRNDKSFLSAGEFPQLGRELRVGAFRTAPVLAGSDPAGRSSARSPRLREVRRAGGTTAPRSRTIRAASTMTRLAQPAAAGRRRSVRTRFARRTPAAHERATSRRRNPNCLASWVQRPRVRPTLGDSIVTTHGRETNSCDNASVGPS